MGIPALENGLFANLLIFDCLYYICLFGKGKRKGKGKGKRNKKRKRKREGKGKREGNYEDRKVTLMRSSVVRDYTVKRSSAAPH